MLDEHAGTCTSSSTGPEAHRTQYVDGAGGFREVGAADQANVIVTGWRKRTEDALRFLSYIVGNMIVTEESEKRCPLGEQR